MPANQLDHISNDTTADATRGSLTRRQHTTEIHTQTDFPAAMGDTITVTQASAEHHSSSVHFVLRSEWVRDMYRSYQVLSCLPADSTAAVSRSGNSVTDLKCNASLLSTPEDALTDILVLVAAPDSPIKRRSEILEHLSAARKILINTGDQDLASAVDEFSNRHDGALRIIAPSGSGVSVDDEIHVPEFGSASVLSIDRKSLNGLEVIVCSVPEQPKKSILSNITNRWSK